MFDDIVIDTDLITTYINFMNQIQDTSLSGRFFEIEMYKKIIFIVFSWKQRVGLPTVRKEYSYFDKDLKKLVNELSQNTLVKMCFETVR